MDEAPARKSGRSATLKFLVGLALVAVCVTAAVFALTAPTQQKPANSVDLMQQEERRGLDCECKVDCVPGAKPGEMGTCEVTAADGKCYGYDNELAQTVSGKWVAKCEVFSGRYNCWDYPCKNEGICLEEVNAYNCKCPYGFEGSLCEKPVSFCPKNVCSRHSSCSECLNANGDCKAQKLPKRVPGRQAYWCDCNDGFHGDGYPKDQTNVFGGSILNSAFLGDSKRYKGWLARTAGEEACTDVDDCVHVVADGKKAKKKNPCKNGSKCTDDGSRKHQFTCDCDVPLKDKTSPMRWTGKLCEQDVNECTKGLHSCVSKKDSKSKFVATCKNTNGSFECSCNAGWAGDGHTAAKTGGGATGCSDIVDCTSKPCKNGGTCVEGDAGSGEFSCNCPTTWKGTLCEKDVNECKERGKEAWCASKDTHGKCSNTAGGFDCVCNEGYTGFPTATPAVECKDEDACAPPNKPCGDAGTCTDLLRGFQCSCKPGYRGKKCDEDWDECALGIDLCHEHAFCKNTHGSYECHCMPGYSGNGYSYDVDKKDAKGKVVKDAKGVVVKVQSTCERIKNCFEYDGNYVRKDKARSSVMKCGVVNQVTGLFEKHGECFPAGGDNVNSYRCECMTGWSNHDCGLDVNECALGTHSCARNSECQNLAGPQKVSVDALNPERKQTLGFKCKCNLGYTGDPYGENCHDIDDCAFIHPVCMKSGAMCLNDGDCKKGDFPGDTCDTTRTKARCANGVCKDLGEHSWTCNCMEGWGDADCGKDVDECADHARFNCGENAVCENTKGSYKCTCEKGYFGDGQTCEEIDDCASNPCAQGNCTDHGVVGYGCKCDAGWVDSKCDHDENECLAGKGTCHAQGVCVNSPGSFYCRCISGMVGDGYICDDLDDCDPNPCSKNVLSGTYVKFGKTLNHNGCKDVGANAFQCKCKRGYTGKYCDELVNECEAEALNDCDRNAICTESVEPPADGRDGYTCECKLDYYGGGKSCALCSDCSEKAPSGGWERDASLTNCNTVHKQDNVCINVNECATGAARCHRGRSKCTDTQGSYNCACNAEFYTKVQSKGMSKKNPREGEPAHRCYPMKKCRLGERMVENGFQFRDRICEPILPNGLYALQTNSDSVSQCLTLWNEPAKVFPERYNWGGKKNEVATKDRMNKPGYIAAADMCKNPICGVCNYNTIKAYNNVKMSSVSSFQIVRLEKDNYLILANRGPKNKENGWRCLGFDRTAPWDIPMPYPQLISWQRRTSEAAKGKCAKRDKGTVTYTKTDCTKDKDCKAGEYCHKISVKDGSWTTDGTGWNGRPTTRDRNGNETPAYFCGLRNLAELKAQEQGNSQAIWNIHALGCQRDTTDGGPRWECQKQKYGNKFLIRSLADGEKLNAGNPKNPSYQAHCLYFDRDTNPTRVPAGGKGEWGGVGYSGPAGEPRTNPDHECGIKPRPGESQEEALLRNKQAVFTFIPLRMNKFDIVEKFEEK